MRAPPEQTVESTLDNLRRKLLVSVKETEASLLELETVIVRWCPEVGNDFKRARENLRNAMTKLER